MQTQESLPVYEETLTLTQKLHMDKEKIQREFMCHKTCSDVSKTAD